MKYRKNSKTSLIKATEIRNHIKQTKGTMAGSHCFCGINSCITIIDAYYCDKLVNAITFVTFLFSFGLRIFFRVWCKMYAAGLKGMQAVFHKFYKNRARASSEQSLLLRSLHQPYFILWKPFNADIMRLWTRTATGGSGKRERKEGEVKGDG